MKNKIATGLALCLIAGICSADELLGAQDVTTQTPFTLPLTNLSTDPGKYYTTNCHVINTHATKQLSLHVSLANGTFSPVLYDGQSFKNDPGNEKSFTIPLSEKDDDKLLVIQKIHAASSEGQDCSEKWVDGDPIMKDETVPVVHHCWYGFWYFCPYTVDEPTGKQVVDRSKTPPPVKKKICTPALKSDVLTFTATVGDGKEMGAGYRISCDLAKDFLASALAADASASAATAPAADVSAPTATTPATDVSAPAATTPATDVSAPAATAPATNVPAAAVDAPATPANVAAPAV